MSIIDDFSIHVWIYLLKNKSETFVNFKNWKIKVENQTSKKVIYLHTNNGLKFCNIEFDNLCNEYGITILPSKMGLLKGLIILYLIKLNI